MIKNYLKIALRSLFKHKVFALINIAGLAVGITCCVLIMMYVSDELAYDQFHVNKERIHKLALERIYPNHSTYYAVVPHSFGDVIQQDFPEVESVVKMAGPFNNTMVSLEQNQEEEVFEEDFAMAADSNFFQVFSLAILDGDARSPLKNNTDVVLTEETARRYFGNGEAVGRSLRFQNRDFSVSAICETPPAQSHMKFDLLFKWDDLFVANGQPNFTGFNSHMYVMLKPDADAAALEAKFPEMVNTYASAQIESQLRKSWEEYKREGNGYRYFLQPLTGIHLDPRHIEAKMTAGGNKNYVYFLVSIAGLILIMACINFMNLATARSRERGREVGVRKTMGSARSQLVRQFLVESVLITFFATLVALSIIFVALPHFNSLTGKMLQLRLDAMWLLGMTGVVLLVGALAGSYPAFVLSSFNPAQVLKGKIMTGDKGALLRNGLVVFQFMTSIVLIACTLIVRDQMAFMQKKSLGYNKDHILVLEGAGGLPDQSTETLIKSLRQLPQVAGAGSSFSLLGDGPGGNFFGQQWTAEGASEILTTKSMAIDDEFAEVIGFRFVAGRGFHPDIHDSLSLILNETAVRTFELTDPVGKKLLQVINTPQGLTTAQFTIIGVVEDFHFQSLRDPITPLTIQSSETFAAPAGYIYARVGSSDVQSAVARAESLWKSVAPDQPFKYLFLDENLHAQYDRERRAGQIFGIFSGIAIVIACIGLFGLAAYTANQRTKEIGIRKVLGATMGSVVVLLSKEFTKLIGIAFLLAVPLSWVLMSRWLHTFAYRVPLEAGAFLIAGLSALLIAWLTVSYLSIRAAVTNPVESLRSE